MCNAHNHPPGCNCGWGGNGHKGKSPGGWGRTYRVSAPTYHASVRPYPTTVVQWPFVSFRNPSRCPVCGCPVFFVRHNGGAVWFDALGAPWPKHVCFDTLPDDIRSMHFSCGDRNNTCAAHIALNHHSIPLSNPIIGVITTVDSLSLEWDRLFIACADGSFLTAYDPSTRSTSPLLGELVLVSLQERKVACIGQNRILPIDVPSSPPKTQAAAISCISLFAFAIVLLIGLNAMYRNAGTEEQNGFPTQSAPYSTVTPPLAPPPYEQSQTTLPSPVNVESKPMQDTSALVSSSLQPVSIPQLPAATPAPQTITPVQKKRHLTVSIDGEDYMVDWNSNMEPRKSDIDAIQKEIRASRRQGEHNGYIWYQPRPDQ